MAERSIYRLDSDLTAGYCWLYAFVRDDTSEVKIGISTRPFARFDEIQFHHGAPLRFAVARVGRSEEERRAHKRFHEFRLSGEWFRLAPPIEKWIKSMQVKSRHVYRLDPQFNNLPQELAERRVMAFLDGVGKGSERQVAEPVGSPEGGDA